MVNLHCAALLKDSDDIVLIGKPIDFYFSVDNVNWTKFDTTNTNGSGIAEADHDIVMDTWIKARFEGSPSYGASQVIKESTQTQTQTSSKSSVLGKSEGFSYWKCGTGYWNKGAGVMANDSGLQLGLWVWDRPKARWEKGGGAA